MFETKEHVVVRIKMKITVKGLAYDKCSVNDSDDEGGKGRGEKRGRESYVKGK